MERGNSRHGPHLDEQMGREARAFLHGAPPGGGVEEWREPELSREDEPDVSAVPRPDRPFDSGAPIIMTDEEREGRSRLGTYLNRSAFPADRQVLLETARAANAPDDIIDELAQLPPNQRYENVARVWSALGHGFDRRF